MIKGLYLFSHHLQKGYRILEWEHVRRSYRNIKYSFFQGREKNKSGPLRPFYVIFFFSFLVCLWKYFVGTVGGPTL